MTKTRPILLTIMLAVAGCGYFSPDEKPAEPQDSDRLEELHEAVQSERQRAERLFAPQSGWPRPGDCDGLLFSGLAAASGLEVDLSLAEREPGKWGRRPDPCWTPEAGDIGAKSECSRDMITGLLWALWRRGDAGNLRELADYLEAHDWYCGRPETWAITHIHPNLQGLIGRMLYVLSDGLDDRSYRELPAAYAPVSEDYAQHIQALGIGLQGEVYEALRAVFAGSGDDVGAPLVVLDVSANMKSRLEGLVAESPDDRLFQALLGRYTGDFSQAVDLCLDDEAPVPTYVRSGEANPDPNYALVHWLHACGLTLEYAGGA